MKSGICICMWVRIIQYLITLREKTEPRCLSWENFETWLSFVEEIFRKIKAPHKGWHQFTLTHDLDPDL